MEGSPQRLSFRRNVHLSCSADSPMIGSRMMVSPNATSSGTTTNHQNNVQTIAPYPDPFEPFVPIPPEQTGLYDAYGLHLGGIYQPLLAPDGALTAAHAQCLSLRPAQRLLFWEGVCANPQSSMALVFMAPIDGDPLTKAPAALPHIVYVLDRGHSVQVHAACEAALDGIATAVAGWLGGARV